LLLQHPQIDIHLRDNNGDSHIKTASDNHHHEIMKLLIQKGANCEKWREWGGFPTLKLRAAKTCEILRSWRSFLPVWTPRNHRVYPTEFKHLAILCVLLFKRLEIKFETFIPKDIKRVLIMYVATEWRKKKEKLLTHD